MGFENQNEADRHLGGLKCMYKSCPHDDACVDGCHCPMPSCSCPKSGLCPQFTGGEAKPGCRAEAHLAKLRPTAAKLLREEAQANADKNKPERDANPPNPKQRHGDLKPNVALNPGTASAYQALAHENGAAKYGPFNWREKAVELMTYVAAAKRHLDAWVDGEDFSADTVDTDKPVHNLGHVMASIAILIDALETPGCAIDNRPKPGGSSRLHERIKELRGRIDVV